MTGGPAAEINVDDRLVQALLREQQPDLAHLPFSVSDAQSGWDNVMVRLGDVLCVRLPRRAAAAKLVEHEQAWLPTLARRLPLPTPVPVRIGVPGCGYPWCWSVVPWLPGESADLSALRETEAARWGEFLAALHKPAPASAPTNPMRSAPLRQVAAVIEERMRWVAAQTPYVSDAVRYAWEAAVVAQSDVEPTWLHGDLHALNVLVDNGVLSGVIDWGDVTAGDRSTDLASLWMLFADPPARQRVLDAYGPVSEATYRRAKGRAIAFAVTLLDTRLADNPRLASIGERTLRRITAQA